ncbi:Hypp1600 [Branchiostoma lanceolatum]|uniref:Hypp1600 protein n=1 Tax=Branchiostoma lanceolatum TaxID=7740 RepID=A0A8J9ZKL2_BRALA|nr:Hypp1600 [Branchiostoma lanceolatum]
MGDVGPLHRRVDQQLQTPPCFPLSLHKPETSSLSPSLIFIPRHLPKVSPGLFVTLDGGEGGISAVRLDPNWAENKEYHRNMSTGPGIPARFGVKSAEQREKWGGLGREQAEVPVCHYHA